MKTKEKILELFESSKGTWFSGEELAVQLSISRTAVWKAVKALRNEGYQIHAIPNKGYCLSTETDILSAQGIFKYLNVCRNLLDLQVLPEVTSTNSLLRDKAEAGAPEGYTIIANAQTAGRGRMGRKFYSPSGTGIYMSLLLRPSGFTPDQAIRIPAMAAVAACETIRDLSGHNAQIKWVNDVWLDGKKVCGILTEASMGMESQTFDYIVLGIGINAYAPKSGFPDEIESIAGTVFQSDREDGKNALAAGFLNRFMDCYLNDTQEEYVKKYRAMNLAIGKKILVLSSKGEKTALALDVDDECRLVVRYEDGSEEHLSYGEISTKIL